MKQREQILTPPTGEFAWKEKVHQDFMTREEFINRTGIFVTPSQFDYIYNVDFKNSGMEVDEFVSKFAENFSGEIMEVEMKGTFKYMITDEAVSCLGEYEDESHDSNIWDIVNSLARSYSQEYENRLEMIEKYKKVLEDAMETNKKFVDMLREIQLQSANPTSDMTS